VESFLTSTCVRKTAASHYGSAYNYTMAQDEYYGCGLALHDQQVIRLQDGFKSSLEESATAVARRVRTNLEDLR
jgi:hypothetical protein